MTLNFFFIQINISVFSARNLCRSSDKVCQIVKRKNMLISQFTWTKSHWYLPHNLMFNNFSLQYTHKNNHKFITETVKNASLLSRIKCMRSLQKICGGAKNTHNILMSALHALVIALIRVYCCLKNVFTASEFDNTIAICLFFSSFGKS